MSKHVIQCWNCGTRLNLDERNENDGDCMECGVELALDDYLVQAANENAKLRSELAALKEGHGEAVAWRDHSVNYAKGEKCPATIETLQAAWDRDQELLIGQKVEISRLKETVNQLRQRRTAPPASSDAVSVPMSALVAALSHPATPDEMLAKIKAAEELRALLAQSQGVKS